jgi:hypothetical protein
VPDYTAIDSQPLNQVVMALFRRKMVAAIGSDSQLTGCVWQQLYSVWLFQQDATGTQNILFARRWWVQQAELQVLAAVDADAACGVSKLVAMIHL